MGELIRPDLGQAEFPLQMPGREQQLLVGRFTLEFLLRRRPWIRSRKGVLDRPAESKRHGLPARS